MANKMVDPETLRATITSHLMFFARRAGAEVRVELSQSTYFIWAEADCLEQTRAFLEHRLGRRCNLSRDAFIVFDFEVGRLML
jgi:hypothetical protein